MKVKDIMSQKLFTLRADHKLDLVDDMMNWKRIRHIPVVDSKGYLVGLVTHRDLLRASVSSLAQLPRKDQRELLQHILVADIMQRNVKTISPEADLCEAAATMMERKLGCLPVVQEEKLVGILTEADFLTLAWEAMGKQLKRKEVVEVERVRHAEA